MHESVRGRRHYKLINVGARVCTGHGKPGKSRNFEN